MRNQRWGHEEEKVRSPGQRKIECRPWSQDARAAARMDQGGLESPKGGYFLGFGQRARFRDARESVPTCFGFQEPRERVEHDVPELRRSLFQLETVPGNRICRHLLRCIETRTGLRPSRDPSRKDRRRNALKTAYISIRSREQPHWLELGVRCDATLHELDRFLRSLWLECCGHVSHFLIGGATYSAVVPKPGDNWRFDPMYDGEEKWRHMGKSVNAAIPVLARFEHEFDYGTSTELVLEHVAFFGELAQWLAPSQPCHGGKIVILARNDSVRPCLHCRRPAQWKAVLECEEDEEYYYEYDEELYEEEGVMSAYDLDR